MKKYSFIVLSVALLLLVSACQKPAENITASNSDKFANVTTRIDGNIGLLSLASTCPAEFYNHTSYCNTSPVKCYNKCLKGNANHCFGLADAFLPENFDSKYSLMLYSRACKLGLATACTNYAATALYHKPNANQSCNARSFKLTCDLLDPWGCTMYANMLYKGKGALQDKQLALKIMNHSCTFGIDDPACANAKALEKMIKAELKAE